jgi:flagellar motility protein MotE (MotC chaperone)
MTNSIGRRGTILALVSLFVLSASIRVVTSTTAVVAAPNEAEDRPFSASFESSGSDTRQQFEALFNQLAEKEAELQDKQLQVAEREKELANAEERIQEKLQKLIEAEEKLHATLALAQSASDNDISQLVSVYENMKPKQAAALFEVMDPQFAAGFLGRMKPQTAASIMSQLKPENSYTISAILAGRNANVSP